MNFIPLFPKFFMTEETQDVITPDLQSFAMGLDKGSNTLNKKSMQSYVLHDFKELATVRKFIEERIGIGFKKLGLPESVVTKPVITQSWFTYSKKGEAMHHHWHPNSLLSGVLYFNAVENQDYISISRPNEYQRIMWYPEEMNEYTATDFHHQVKTGSFILFGSELNHSFNDVQHNETRVSLAFNTFIQGFVGDRGMLTELKLTPEAGTLDNFLEPR